MESIEKTFETAVSAALVAAINGEQSITEDVAIRCWHLDDEPESPAEDLEYPCIEVQAAALESSGCGGPLHTLSLTLAPYTHIVGDPKHATLDKLLCIVRVAINADTLNPLLPASMVCAGAEPAGPSPEIEGNASADVMQYKIWLAVVPATTTE